MQLSIEQIKTADKQNMLDILKNFASQCKAPYSSALSQTPYPAPKQIIFAGMGGSGISGDIISVIASENSETPCFVCKDYSLPNWARGKKTLVVAISYSGNTEETISMLEEAIAHKNPIICISNNGKIEQIAKENTFPFIEIPAGYLPRCALGHLFFSCHRILEIAKILPPIKPDFFIKMENWIERFLPESNNNLAKNIAIKLHNKIALLYSGNKLSPALTRWKTQLSENSKTFAFMNTYPESSHNDIMSWRHPEWFIKQSIPIFFVSCKEHKKVSRQLDISQEIIFKKPSGIISLTSEGDTLLEELFYFIVLGDWVSFYLGILNNENPTEIAEIQLLKQKLGG